MKQIGKCIIGFVIGFCAIPSAIYAHTHTEGGTIRDRNKTLEQSREMTGTEVPFASRIVLSKKICTSVIANEDEGVSRSSATVPKNGTALPTSALLGSLIFALMEDEGSGGWHCENCNGHQPHSMCPPPSPWELQLCLLHPSSQCYKGGVGAE